MIQSVDGEAHSSKQRIISGLMRQTLPENGCGIASNEQ
jgi:hypothetical protein